MNSERILSKFETLKAIDQSIRYIDLTMMEAGKSVIVRTNKNCYLYLAGA